VPSYETRVLDSWDAYLKVITDSPYANWAFRGQADAAWPLSSTLTRYFTAFGIPQQEWELREQRALRIFKRKATHFLTHVPALEDDFEWMALMQHHGAPTRLLDFTWSPYVAVFFALERAERDASVWALNPAEFPAVGELGRFTLDELNTGKSKFQVAIGRPYIMNRRLIAQSGTLVVSGTVGRPVEVILRNPAATLVKLVLRRDAVRLTAMRELYRMNITHATLFPDLDGLARSLAYELEFKWWR
jgi:hypothetical protein